MKIIKLLRLSFLFFILVLSFSQLALADEAVSLPTIDELRVPSSPAFNLLGISPSAINRPATPKAIAISILEATGKSGGDFPKNFALEVAPFWLFSHPKLTFEDYYNKTGFGESILETLSLSIGTTQTTTTIDSLQVDTTRMGIGIRTNLLSGNAAPGLSDKIKKLKDAQLECLNDIPMTGDIPDKPNCSKLKEAALAIQKFNKTRVGWLLEVAAAGTWDFPENKSSNSEFTRFGAWLTPSYHSGDLNSPIKNLTFLGVGRYIHEKFNNDNSDIFDVGFSVLWMSEELPFSFSAEYVHRFKENTGDDRLVGILEYKINDTYSIFASYGKTFDNSFEGDKDLVAILGINFGWGKGPVIKQ